MGYGGPHAAFFATRDEYKRFMPGRIIGVSRDRDGRAALRMALQTREQHIRRDKATSNVCTAQVLLAVMASMYAVYHGPGGLRRIAERVHTRTVLLANALRRLRYRVVHEHYFDTLCVEVPEWALPRLLDAARARKINLRPLPPTRLCIALDETVTLGDLADVIAVFSLNEALPFMLEDIGVKTERAIPAALERKSAYLTHPVFHLHHSETEMLRYIKRLEARDLSLTAAMIPLGSCTMKLNATTEMMPVSWREFNRLHPFAPRDQAAGYQLLFSQLEYQLAEITGFAAVSLAAQRRLAGRIRRTARHPRLSPGEGRGSPDDLSDPPIRARDQPRERRDGRDAGGAGQERRAGQRGCGRPSREGGGAQGHAGRPDGDVPLHPRRVRGLHPGDLPDRPRARRPGLHGRRQHERAGGPLPAGRRRRRRLSPEPAQDVLHSPRRRRAGHGPDRRREASGAVPAGPSGRGARSRAGMRDHLGRAVGQRGDPARSPGPTSP